MKLKLFSSHKDLYPQCGFFIEGPLLETWLEVLSDFEIDPTLVEIHGLPSNEANTIWGCLVLGNLSIITKELGVHTSAHHLSNKLFLPEKTGINPLLTAYDMEQLFLSDRFVYHPDFGFCKLEEPISLMELFVCEDIKTIATIKPIVYKANLGRIKSFRVEATSEEQLKLDIDSKTKRERIKDKPLSLAEKLKLKLYNQLFTLKEDKDGRSVTIKPVSGLMRKALDRLGLDNPQTKEEVFEDFKDLQERNKKEVDKLMDMLKNNPEDALRFAIPLDEHGYNRGENDGRFRLEDRGMDFGLLGKLFGSLGGGYGSAKASGGSVNLGDDYFRLQTQYRETALALKNQGKYEKAAFIYLKLLKDYHSAAEALKEGQFYEKAAYIYLEYQKNELSAAQCFEQGRIYDKAIDLYKKNNKTEKVGDIYALIGKQSLSREAYQTVVDDYLRNSKFIKAAILSKTKMSDLVQAQKILLGGWRNQKDEFNCLNNYLNNYTRPEEVWEQIENLQAHEVDETNEIVFLKVLKHEYKRQPQINRKIRDIAYVLISKLLAEGKIQGNEILAFNKSDSRLSADAARYQMSKNKRLK